MAPCKKSSKQNKNLVKDEEEGQPEERMKWSRQCDFLLSLIGYGVGIGNVWRFPYVCAKNGGAVFLIPYAVFMIILAFPLIFLELSLGQYSGKSTYGVWDISPAFRGIGISMTAASVMCCLYYNTILAWILYYIAHVFMSPLPWTNCDNWWNTENCYIRNINNSHLYLPNNTMVNQSEIITNTSLLSTNVSKSYTPTEEFWNFNMLRISTGIDDFGSLQWHLVVALAAAWLIIFLCLIKGVKSVGKVVYITATAPYILITIILIKAVTLPGAMQGIEFYVIPDFTKLGEVQVWIQALLQLFYSVGIGWGAFITMASFNRYNNNILRDSLVYAIIGEGTSFYAGFSVFAILGYMAHETGLDVENLIRTGPGLIFITYPEVLSNLPIPQLWTFLFLFMITTIALDTMFVTVEVLISMIVDVKKISGWKKRAMVTGVCCFVMFLITIIYATQAGIYIFQLVDWYMASITVIVVAALECVVVGWVYGVDRYLDNLESMLGRRPSVIFKILWKFIIPALLFIVLIITLVQYEPPTYGDYKYPYLATVCGWVIAVITAIPIPVWMIKEISQQKGTLRQRIVAAMRPNSDWGPVKDYEMASISNSD